MDISVRQLNGRLAMKLPPELPLGLVFVVGQVSRFEADRFVLVDEPHSLDCRAVGEVSLKPGDEVRVGGHLMFDSERLQYYLLARDIEIVVAESLPIANVGTRELLAENESLLSALAAVKARAAVAPTEKQVPVPVWVQKLAPQEMQSAIDGADAEVSSLPTPVEPEIALDAGLVSMLSAAMDSEEDLELTPALLASYQVEKPVPVAERASEDVARLMDTAVPDVPTSYQPANREDTDWLVILLIISFFVFTLAIIVTIVLLIL